MLPQHLVVEFWLDVRNRLEKDYHLGQKAAKGISDYIEISEKHDFTDMIYHRSPEEVANTIASSIDHGGFREPSEFQS